MSEYLARSPIAPSPPVRAESGWEVSGCRSAAAVTIADHTPLAKVYLRAQWDGAMAKALGVPFGRACRVPDGPDGLVVGSGPGEWTVLAPPGTAGQVTDWLATLVAGLLSKEFISVVDMTHGRALMRITGHDTAELLARLCGADLHDDMAPDGAALRSSVAGVATDIVRDDRAGVPSYLLHCDRSSGQYLFDALTGAGESLGIGIDGFRLPGI